MAVTEPLLKRRRHCNAGVVFSRTLDGRHHDIARILIDDAWKIAMPFLDDAVFAPRSAAFPKEKIFEYEIPLASVKRRFAILAGNVATIALRSRLDPDEVIMRVASWAIEE